ncbi:MAG: nucleoside deaminase [Deltaproteobacteria bacterium]|nr:nucleoside deaminase [Deltaproteobacteria bacterium]
MSVESASNVHLRFMAEALHEARVAGSEGEVPVGAVVVRGDEIIGRGRNQREAWQDPTAHAEVLALRAAAATIGSWRLDGCTLYVTLEPCAMCAGAVILGRVGLVVFATGDPKGGFVGTLGDLSRVAGLNHQFEVVRGPGEAEAAGLLRQFFRDLRSATRDARSRS